MTLKVRTHSFVLVSVKGAGFLLAGGLMMAEAIPAAAATPPLSLVCVVAPGQVRKTAFSPAQICESFRVEIERTLGETARIVATSPKARHARWIRIDIGFPRRNAIEAALTSHYPGKTTIHPKIAVDVMDKSLGSREISSLARAVAAALGTK